MMLAPPETGLNHRGTKRAAAFTTSSVTRTFFEIFDFFSENVEKIVKKGQNCVKSKNLCNKMKLLYFYY